MSASLNGTNPLIQQSPAETLSSIQYYVSHVAESLESDPDKRGLLISIQLINEALTYVKLDQSDDQCHTHLK